MNTKFARAFARFNFLACAALLIAGLGANPTLAANKTWDGGGEDNFWRTGVNWDANTAPVAGDSLFFTLTTRLNNTNNFPAGTPFSGLTFNAPAGAFDLRGNSISLSGGITNNQDVVIEMLSLPLALSATPFISVITNGSLSIGGAISGTGLGLTKVGDGLLTLSGANTFDGPLMINAGTVSVGSDGNLGAAPSAVIPANIVINGGTLRASSSFTINANRGIALGSTSGTGGGTMDVLTGLTVTYGGVLANNGGTGGLSKSSFGGLTLSGANTYTGPTTIKNGTITLDFTQASSPVNNIISGSSPLILGGENSGRGAVTFSALTVNGAAGIANSQTFNGTSIQIGPQVIRVNSGAGGAANIHLGELTHVPNGDVTFVPPAALGGAGNITTTTTNVNGILGGWALIGNGSQLNGMTIGTNWASVDASGNIVNFTNHVVYQSAWGKIHGNVTAADNLLIDDTSGAGTTVIFDNEGAGTLTEVNTINIRRSAAWTLRIGSNNTVRLGKYGSIFKSDTTEHAIVVGFGDGGTRAIAGAQDQGGILTAGGAPNTPGEIVFNFNQASQGDANHQMVMARITDNGSGVVTVVKAGSGPLNLGGHNTHSGGTYMIQGRVQAGGGFIGTINPDAYGSGPIYVFPGCYLYLNPAPPGGTTVTLTNDLFLAGNGTQAEQLGCVRFQNAGWEIASKVTLIGDATIGGNNGRPGITGPIQGPFSLTMGSGATVAGVVRYSNPGNDWTGGTIMQSRNTAANSVESGASEIIPHGFGRGNVTMLGLAGGTITWNLNGFNETINGLALSGNGPSCFIVNNGTEPSTLTVGDNDQSATFGGTISDGSAPLALTKIGAGLQTLTGPNTYTGPTTVSGGTLALSGAGAIASSEIIGQNGGALDVTGISDFTAATLRLTNATLVVDAANVNLTTLAMTNAALTLVPDTGDISVNATTLTTGGLTNRIHITTVAGVAGYPAEFTLIKYSGAIGGAGNNFGLGEVPSTNTVGYVSNDVANARLVLVLLDGPKPLTWTGTAGWDWDLGLTTNWLAFKGTPNVVPAAFSQADSTFFDDTGLTNNINLTGVLAPGGITVNNSTLNYTFAGDGTIAGLGGLVKNGTGTLTLANTGGSQFRGGLTANAGTVILATDNAIAGGTSVSSGASVHVGTNGPTGNLPAGNVQNEGSILFNRTNNFTVGNVISGNGVLTKNNAGVLTLSGANSSFTGPVTVVQGTVRAGNNAALGTEDGTTTINSGATLDIGGNFALNTEPVIVSGAGVTNGGAIVNTGAESQNALGNVILAGHTTFGGTGRWDIRGGAASLTTSNNAYHLTKIGNNQISLVGVTIDATPGASLADIIVSNGIFSVETTTSSLGDPARTLTVYTNGTLQFFGTTTAWDKQIVLHGGTVNKISSPNGANTIDGPISLNLACILNVGGTSLTLNGPISGGGGLTKIGTSPLTLNGAATYTGNTIVNAGTLVINNLLNGGGSLSNSVGTTLAGNGTNNGPVRVNGSLVPGGANVAGTFGSDELTMTNALITFDLGTNAVGGAFPANDLIFADGNLNLQGTNTITLLAGPIGAVTSGQVITLFQFTGTLTGGTNNLRLVVPPGYGFTLLDPATTPGFIRMSVTKSPLNIVWRGGAVANPTAWDIETTLNWVNAADNVTPADYSDLDAVNFGDTANTNLVTLAASLQPSAINLNNSAVNYTFAGSGRITGPSGLKVQGGGSLIIANSGTNNFSGPVEITAGLLQVGSGGPDGNLGTGPITNSAGLAFDRSGNLTVTAGIHGTGPLTNKGPGVVTLSGASTFEGEVVIEQGTLRAGSGSALGNPLASGTTTIASGATLDVGGQALNNEAITVGGAGVGGLGAIINSGADQINALGNVTLTSDTSFGGTGRWDIRGGLAILSTGGNPFNLTKVGPNQVSLVGVGVDAALSNIFVQSGIFSVETTTSTLGNPLGTVSVSPGATLQFFGTTTPWEKAFVFSGNGVANTVNVANGTGNTISGGVTLNGGCIFNTTVGTALSLGGALGGGGSLIKRGDSSLTLNGANSYAGDTTINGGALILVGAAALPATPTSISVGAGATLDVTALTAGPTLTLASGQTLQGNGSINGSVVSPAGSTVAPGLSVGLLNVTNNVTLGGTTIMELDGSAGTNDAIRSVTGSITYGGTLNLVSLGPLPGGSSYKLFYATSYPGSFTLNPPTPGPGQTWDISTLNTDGTLRVVGNPPATTRPVIVSTTRIGLDLVISGTNGTAGGQYYVLEGTNIVQPVATWERIATNTFINGNFSFTNTVELNVPQRFYQLLVP